MKKYELIKQYPGSDHVGVVVSQKTLNGMYEGWEYNYYKRHVENNPEYWEEVIEKDFQILTFMYGGGIDLVSFLVTSDESLFQPSGLCVQRTAEQLLKEGHRIHSVKRLSDGEVFTVGDRAKVYEYGSIKTIDSMHLVTKGSSMKEGIWLTYNSGSSHITNAIKQEKQPIFLTHDGKDIFEGDKVWYVNKESPYNSSAFIAISATKFYSDMNAYFLTQEAASDYISRNKILFTTEDGVGIKRGDTYYCVNTAPHLWSLFEQTSKERTQLNKTVKAFSTYEAAQYYIIVNAKVLSIEDFYNAISSQYGNGNKLLYLQRLVKERLNLK